MVVIFTQFLLLLLMYKTHRNGMLFLGQFSRKRASPYQETRVLCHFVTPAFRNDRKQPFGCPVSEQVVRVWLVLFNLLVMSQQDKIVRLDHQYGLCFKHCASQYTVQKQV
jgi:hypothetical protein